jgi:predicted transcriptional regulator
MGAVERDEARERFKQEATVSWTAYRETGRHLDSQDLRAWLDSWGSEEEAERPDCHS